jgi:SulP family sulfate permease
MRIHSIPILSWLPAYQGEWLRPDLIAGMTTSAVIIPKAMAYATIAGVPVEIGLYTALVPMMIYAILGTSRPLSVSTTTAIAILSAGELALVVPGGNSADLVAAATTLALLVGAVLVLAWVLKLGFLANFISAPVLTGFKAGIGVIVVVDQAPKLLGLHFIKTGFFRDLGSILGKIPETIVPTLVLSLATLALLILLERRTPRVPAPLVAVVVGIALSGLIGFGGAGVELVGKIPSGLPSFELPNLSLVEKLWPAALGIALMSFTESVAAGRAFTKYGEPRPDANQELLALGLSNLAGGFFQVMPAGGGTSQTAVNRGAGARTQVSELVTVAMVVATVLVLAPMISLMPQATLAAVVVATSIPLINPEEFREIRRVRSMEFWWAIAAVTGVILLGALKGILVAVVASMLAMLHQANHPLVYVIGRKRGTNVFRPLSAEHPDDETFPGLLIFRPQGRIHFANAQRVGDKMWPLVHEKKPWMIVIDCRAVPDIEYTALMMLADAERKLRESGITLCLAALNPEALRAVERSPIGKTLGPLRIFTTLDQVVSAYQKHMAMERHG